MFEILPANLSEPRAVTRELYLHTNCKQTLTVDWFEVHCRGVYKELNDFVYKVRDYGTSVFAKITDVIFKGQPVGTFYSIPYSPIMKSDLVMFKASNKACYVTDIISSVTEFINHSGLILKGITRLDICSDFTEFKNGLKPNSLINKILSGAYVRNGRGMFSVVGEQQEEMNFTYLKFGHQDSKISVYLYNKSKEMNEVKFKQHIADAWRAAGVNSEVDVWRLEVSIKDSSLSILSESSGEILSNSVYCLNDWANVFELYKFCINKYFDIRRKAADTNKSRMKKVELFDWTVNYSRRMPRESFSDYTRSDRLFISKAVNEAFKIGTYDKPSANLLRKTAWTYAQQRDLLQWAYMKFGIKAIHPKFDYVE